jgi:hypothetical protein
MSNKKIQPVIQFVIPVILLLIAILVVSCNKRLPFSGNTSAVSEDTDGGSSGGGGIGIGQTTFTLTDIPSKYEGKYARISLVGEGLLTGAQNITSKSVTLPKISGGKVVIPIWRINSVTSFSKYTDNGTFTLGTVNLYNSGNDNVNASQKELVDAVFMSITFSKGNATRSWKDALTVIEQ